MMFPLSIKAAFFAGAMAMLSGCAGGAGGWYGGVDGGPTAALTSKQSAVLEKNLAGKVAGAPKSCLRSYEATQPIRVSDSTILYRVSRNKVYRNDLRSTCPGLARDHDIMVTRSFGSSDLCDGDIVQLVDRSSGMIGASCSFGKFVPYTAPATGA